MHGFAAKSFPRKDQIPRPGNHGEKSSLTSTLFLLAGFSLWGGCGGGEPFSMVPVSGKVVYEDGSVIPAPQLQVIFVPQTPPVDKKTYPRQGLAYVNPKDGTFSNVTSHRPGDGVVIGRAKVIVKSFDDRGNPTALVPAAYQDLSTTPLEVEVSKESREFTLKIDRKYASKPKTP